MQLTINLFSYFIDQLISINRQLNEIFFLLCLHFHFNMSEYNFSYLKCVSSDLSIMHRNVSNASTTKKIQ